MVLNTIWQIRYLHYVDLYNLFEWFKSSHLKANADKCHLLVTRDTDVTAKIG